MRRYTSAVVGLGVAKSLCDLSVNSLLGTKPHLL
jgi:hypothetical protein